MLNGYLKPEKLEGDNKYHCEKCGSLEEAVKTTDILESPNHLKCTLMRFEYDRERGTKRKILTDIKYKLSLNLPSGKVGEPKEEQVRLFLLLSESRNQAQFVEEIPRVYLQ
jgi:ubiquitin C-terminal hydrolase